MNFMLRRVFKVEFFFLNIACRTTYTVQYEVYETGNDLTLNQSAYCNCSTQHSTLAICARTHQTSRTGQTELQSTPVATTNTNIHKYQSNAAFLYTGLFISPSRTSELDCATTKTDTAERSISIGRESLKVFFCTRGLGVLAGSTARGLS